MLQLLTSPPYHAIPNSVCINLDRIAFPCSFPSIESTSIVLLASHQAHEQWDKHMSGVIDMCTSERVLLCNMGVVEDGLPVRKRIRRALRGGCSSNRPQDEEGTTSRIARMGVGIGPVAIYCKAAIGELVCKHTRNEWCMTLLCMD